MTEAALKHISIRGVNAATFDEFSNRIRRMDITLGEALSSMMEQVLKDFDETFPELSAENLRSLADMKSGVIQHHSHLIITQKDLLDAHTRFVIQHVKELVFDEDVDAATFQKYIIQIQHCGTVKIPRVLPRLKILSYISHGGEIVQYEKK